MFLPSFAPRYLSIHPAPDLSRVLTTFFPTSTRWSRGAVGSANRFWVVGTRSRELNKVLHGVTSLASSSSITQPIQPYVRQNQVVDEMSFGLLALGYTEIASAVNDVDRPDKRFTRLVSGASRLALSLALTAQCSLEVIVCCFNIWTACLCIESFHSSTAARSLHPASSYNSCLIF